MGRVRPLAYGEANRNLAVQLGGLRGPGGAPAPAKHKMVTATRETAMFTGPSTQSPVVRPVDQGMRLYPTGNKNGLMWEVKDGLGSRGWGSWITFEVPN